MKKAITIFTILIIILLGIFAFTNKTYAAERIIDNETEGKLVELKETQTKSLKEYQDKYGSDVYGLVAYILNIVRIYSIPFCFLGITISGIYQYVIGIRNMGTRYKGFFAVIAFVTILIICQVLPFIFVVVVKFGRS